MRFDPVFMRFPSHCGHAGNENISARISPEISSRKCHTLTTCMEIGEQEPQKQFRQTLAGFGIRKL